MPKHPSHARGPLYPSLQLTPAQPRRLPSRPYLLLHVLLSLGLHPPFLSDYHCLHPELGSSQRILAKGPLGRCEGTRLRPPRQAESSQVPLPAAPTGTDHGMHRAAAVAFRAWLLGCVLHVTTGKRVCMCASQLRLPQPSPDTDRGGAGGELRAKVVSHLLRCCRVHRTQVQLDSLLPFL